MACRLKGTLFALFLCAAATAASAALAPRPAVRVGGALLLTPGQRVSISWDSLPKGADEFEFLLRCESPTPLTLRLTECKDPSLTVLEWCVPAVPCTRARLVIRFGEEGEERLWAESAPFRILDRPSPSSERIVLKEGELWVCEGTPDASSSLAAGSLRVAAAPNGSPYEADAPVQGWAAASTGSLSLKTSPRSAPRSTPARLPASRVPLLPPLRI